MIPNDLAHSAMASSAAKSSSSTPPRGRAPRRRPDSFDAVKAVVLGHGARAARRRGTYEAAVEVIPVVAAVHATTTTTTLAARRAARSTGVTAGRRTATNAMPVVHRSMASLGGKRTLGTLGRATHVVTRAQGDDEPQTRGGDDEPDRDEDGLYIGTYSNFFTDPDQLKGVVIFCAFLASFLSLGNIGAAILLPILYDQPISTCIQGILFGYYCPGQDGPLP